jgi:hypothetical protein
MTPLPVCRSVPMVDREMVAGYEELRRQVLGASDSTRGGWGLTLFLRQGMRSWMEAGSVQKLNRSLSCSAVGSCESRYPNESPGGQPESRHLAERCRPGAFPARGASHP